MENYYQTRFFQKLKSLIPTHKTMQDEICTVLEISESSAYRRLRGKIQLSVDEAIKICSHYKIPVSWIGDGMPGHASFLWQEENNSMESFHDYLKMMEHLLGSMMGADKKEMIYAALDAPLFHYFGVETLAHFKMHFWMNVIMGVPELKGKYAKSSIPSEFLTQAKNIYELYLRIPSKEILCNYILNTTLWQIQYYSESGLFVNREQLAELLDALDQLLNHIERMCEQGRKIDIDNIHITQYDPFTLYISDLLPGGNTVLTNKNDVKTIFLSHHTFESITINDEAYCNKTERWLNRMIATSTLISGTAEKNRFRFFGGLRESVEGMRRKIVK